MATKIILFAVSIFILLIFVFIRKWIRFYKIIRFRENLKVGDYCTIDVNGRIVTGFVTKYWPQMNLVQVNHQGITYKKKIDEVYP